MGLTYAEIITGYVSGSPTRRKAIAAFKEIGMSRPEAEHDLFIADGGDDVIVVEDEERKDQR